MNPVIETEERLEKIFEKQKQLATRFHEIERQTMPGSDQGIVVNLQTYVGQARMRELAARTAIEVTEVVRAKTRRDGVEEIADVLHFLVELFLAGGLKAADVAPACGSTTHDRLQCAFSATTDLVNSDQALHDVLTKCDIPAVVWVEFQDSLWHWMNNLKAKPWKLNPKPTDVKKFRAEAPVVFASFLMAVMSYGIEEEELFQAYFRKHQINEQRISEG